jgi:phage-related protein
VARQTPRPPKPLVWLADRIKKPPFTKNGSREAGSLLRQLQLGALLSPPQSKPMPSIGKNVHELKIRDQEHYWRVIYRIDDDAIVIAHIFAKKTQKTPSNVITTCIKRLKKYDTDSQE